MQVSQVLPEFVINLLNIDSFFLENRFVNQLQDFVGFIYLQFNWL